MKFVNVSFMRDIMSKLPPSMPSLDFDIEEFGHLSNGAASTGLTIDANDEAFLSEMYGPRHFNNSRQNNESSQARPASSTETPSSANANSIEKLLTESPFLKKLSENQASLTESHTLLVQNQEKLLKGQESLESTLKEILNELRCEKSNDKEHSFKARNNQKRARSGENEIDANAIIRSKKPKMEIPLNINKTLYFNHSLTKICIICKKRYERIVVHYKTCHSLSEVVASRLSPKMAEEIQKDHPKSSIVVKSIDKLIEAQCVFCEDEKAFTATYWPNHIQAHTGEYKNKCPVCCLLLPFPSYHCQQRTRNIDEFRLDEADLTVHLCLVCNYAQIEVANMINHLKTQHKFSDDVLDDKYKLITLLSIKNERKMLRHQTKIEYTSEDTNDDAEVNLSSSESIINEVPNVIDLDDFGAADHSPAENTKYWRMQKAIKNDPAEKEHLLAVAEHYKQSKTYAFKVKQWISEKWTKPTISIISQFALFKCMHSQCRFSSSSKEDMESHMEHHLALIDVLQDSADGTLDKTVRGEQIKFRDCSYCDFNAHSNKEILDHVLVEHEQCIFQCAYCFYRSVEVDNITLHYDVHHAKEEREIYLCGDVREFREQDREMLQEDVGKIPKIQCGQDDCLEEYGTFDDLFHHLDNEHPNNANYKCKYCDATVSHQQIQSHLNAHNFWEFECIYCKSFGDNDILKLRNHLSLEHSSKFSFAATRRRMPGVDLMADFIILYIGDLYDQNLYKFSKLPNGCDLSCMDPSLYAYESHQTQQNEEVEKIAFTEPFPHLTFSGASSDFFLKYDYPYLCTADAGETGVVCNFRSNKEEDLLRHISKKHSDRQITYKTVESMSQVEKVTKRVICEFECNLCHKLYKTRKEIGDHIKKTHSTNVFDSKIIQHIEVIESSDPQQPVETKSTISNRLQFSGLFVCLKDGKYATTKSQLIAHHRRDHSPTKWLEFQIQTVIYDPSDFGWSTDALTQENEKFDRMMAYECFHCRNELITHHALFESLEEVQKHCREMHEMKDFLYMPKKLVSCVECSTISTIDGMKYHYLRNHPTAEFTIIASPTSKHHCGVCNLYIPAKTNLAAKGLFVEHFQKEHQSQHIELFDDRMLKRLQIRPGDQAADLKFTPECCNENQFTSIQQLVNHIIDCAKVDAGVKSSFELGNVKEFMRIFFNAGIFFDNGLTVMCKSIKNSTIGQFIRDALIDEISKTVQPQIQID
ncbi:uncharacterized protein LOC129566958 [Sitodiplosis mosellana]|uniref:uncharacterized protein LOC129566958 n=1 Tax=Sitodiplosis mosellana TaxID=263140 RepID=UPI00244392D5|nr:uncharacterized protein LOC129566958 [Sitodiplosis mosellana]XP_055299347.1 uncharacterized protein LOC129566958 [Sitodiplosis mosellana]XP_055299348.1 uncharacterized protein LOC129566958 [Sitodiplosis mosellana]XP_055299350.1 uncharacterized protein LOC129566958 [Sitodiplosis mosellana]